MILLKNLQSFGGGGALSSAPKFSGFTLAEVLITLSIIGVVAALTIPTLIQRHQEQKTVSQLLKVYSTLSQAFLLMQSEYGPIDTWGLTNTDTNKKDPETNQNIYDLSSQKIVAERLKPYLKVSKTCELDKVCRNRPEYDISGNKISDKSIVTSKSDSPPEANFFLDDGTFIGLGYYNSSESIPSDINVVLSGNDKVVLGKNIFFFNYNKKGVFPEGTQSGYSLTSFDNCNPDDKGTRTMRGCTAWVIYNKNLDYLHCRSKLGWDKQHSCKK